LALRADGSVVAWGWEDDGQLGNGAISGGLRAKQPTPVPVVGLEAGSGTVAIDAGYSHSLALRSDGSVVAWGSDQFGELGDGGPSSGKPVPVPVIGLGSGSGVVAVSAGLSHSLALHADGRVVAWGSDYSGQLGDADFGVSEQAPVSVRGLGVGSGVIAVSAGGGHSLALLADETVLSWGSNEYGQVGDGGPADERSTPVAVQGLGTDSGAVSVAAGFQHSVVAKR